MSLPPFSKKVLSEIASGTRHPNGKKKVPVEVLSAKRADQREALNAAISQSRMSGKVVDKVFGKRVKSVRSKAMEAADKWFSEWIRLRDSDATGRVTCVTCSHTDHWRYLQCGHMVTRGNQSTRYDERNCTTQCRGCNYNGGKTAKHKDAIDRKYGLGTAQALEDKGRVECKRNAGNFQFIADTYKERVEWIKQHEPGKFKTP